MINLGRFPILGVKVSAVDIDYAVDRIIQCAKESKALSVSALAVHGVMTGAFDSVHRRRLNGIELVVPDGQPVRWALSWIHGINLSDRIRGSDLTFSVLKEASRQGLSVYFYGSTEECLRLITKEFKKSLPEIKIAGFEPSKFRRISQSEKEEVASRIKNSGAKIVFVGLGCPRQEVWVYEYRNYLSMPLIAVGAAFDFQSGLLRQAPHWMQVMGLGWLHRLMQEPKRLWKRYMVMNPQYVVLVLLEALRLRKTESLTPDGTEPEEFYG